MNFNPDNYNVFTDSLQPATKLINIINEQRENNNNLEVIVDIGCGTGSTTRLLNDFQCDRIVGCDIDPKMIGFAQKYNSTDKIDYVVQDFGAEWDQLDPELRELEGKVSVVFTNYAMAWIYDNKHNAATNIQRLLAEDGIFVGNILYDGDIFKCLPPSERKKAFDLIPYPSEEEFVGGWVMSLKSAGLNRIELDYWEPKIIMSEDSYVNDYINIPMNWYKQYIKCSNGTNQDIDQTLKKLIFDERCKRLGKTEDGVQMIEIVNRLWQFVAMKR